LFHCSSTNGPEPIGASQIVSGASVICRGERTPRKPCARTLRNAEYGEDSVTSSVEGSTTREDAYGAMYDAASGLLVAGSTMCSKLTRSASASKTEPSVKVTPSRRWNV
jgi:hypothetical protein